MVSADIVCAIAYVFMLDMVHISVSFYIIILRFFIFSEKSSMFSITLMVCITDIFIFSMNAYRQMQRSKVYIHLAPIGRYSVQ